MPDMGGFPVGGFRGAGPDMAGFPADPYRNRGPDMAGFPIKGFCEKGPEWAVATVPISLQPRGVAASNSGLWVMTGQSGGGTTANVVNLYSYDGGQTWQQGNFPTGVITAGTSLLTYGNGVFLCIGQGASTGSYTVDGVNWSAWNNGATFTTSFMTFGDGFFYAPSGASTLHRSESGISGWKSASLPATANSVAAGAGAVIAIGAGVVPQVSYDNGQTFNNGGALPTGVAALAGTIAYGNGIFVVAAKVAGTTTAFAYSRDRGQSWQLSAPTPTGSAAWNYVIYSQGRFLAVSTADVGGTSKIITSVDGANWETAFGQLSTLVSAGWRLAADGLGHYVAWGVVGADSLVAVDYGTC